jgi:hypothetical protein
MRPLGQSSMFRTLLALTGWVCYVGLTMQHFYDTAVLTPQTQRVTRNVKELRLPRLYFCPADRGHMDGFEWASFECTLSYKDERRSCPGRLQSFQGRTPRSFKGSSGKRAMGDGPGEMGESQGGQCLEFGTHRIGVREEWSAAWNEITLRAAFTPADTTGISDALWEVELGYLPVEWEMGMKSSTVERYYYPLLRVPFFFNGQEEAAPGGLHAAAHTWSCDSHVSGARVGQGEIENVTVRGQHGRGVLARLQRHAAGRVECDYARADFRWARLSE